MHPQEPTPTDPTADQAVWRELARLEAENAAIRAESAALRAAIAALRERLRYYGAACDYMSTEMIRLSSSPGALPPDHE